MKKECIKVWLIGFGLVILDQLSKFFVTNPTHNTGIAFGIPINQTIIIIGTVILLPTILYLLKKELQIKKPITQAALALILGGGVSNLIDRVAHGYVIDFISIWKWPSFNLADAFIVVGILLIVVFYGKINKNK